MTTGCSSAKLFRYVFLCNIKVSMMPCTDHRHESKEPMQDTCVNTQISPFNAINAEIAISKKYFIVLYKIVDTALKHKGLSLTQSAAAIRLMPHPY